MCATFEMDKIKYMAECSLEVVVVQIITIVLVVLVLIVVIVIFMDYNYWLEEEAAVVK